MQSYASVSIVIAVSTILYEGWFSLDVVRIQASIIIIIIIITSLQYYFHARHIAFHNVLLRCILYLCHYISCYHSTWNIIYSHIAIMLLIFILIHLQNNIIVFPNKFQTELK